MFGTKSLDRRVAGILVLAVVAVMGGAFVWQSIGRAQPVGPQAAMPTGLCTVYLRGDVSGLAIRDRAGDLGLLISHTGQLVQLNDQWIALADKDQTWWIPRTSVALIISKS